MTSWLTYKNLRAIASISADMYGVHQVHNGLTFEACIDPSARGTIVPTDGISGYYPRDEDYVTRNYPMPVLLQDVRERDAVITTAGL